MSHARCVYCRRLIAHAAASPRAKGQWAIRDVSDGRLLTHRYDTREAADEGLRYIAREYCLPKSDLEVVESDDEPMP